MSKSTLIISKSGGGKSSSLRNLDEKTTFLFSVLGKGLPFAGSKKKYTIFNKENNPEGNVVVTSSSKIITEWLKYISTKMPHITTVVVDDSTFLAAKELDRRREETGYKKFNDIAHDFLSLSEVANTLRDNLNIYFLYHTEEQGDGVLEEKTQKAMSHGKMISEKLASIEAQFEIVLLACKLKKGDDDIEYKFKTRDTTSTTKSPMGMFEDEYIDNDLALVNQRIKEYYE